MNCKFCKVEFPRDDLIIFNCVHYKDHSYIYYACRKCNSDKAARYRSTPDGRANIYRAVKKSISKHRYKQLARYTLNNSLKSGAVEKPDKCTLCGGSKPEAHHTNYDRPLDVTWLCRLCHAKEHKVSVV